MKYVKTIDLWAEGVQSALKAGALRLQSGQWVRCGQDSKPSRFDRCDTRTGYIKAFHYPNASKAYQYVKDAEKASQANQTNQTNATQGA